LNQLVFIDKNQAVTDSLTVAEVFGKNHADVLRDIRKMECSEEFRLRNFAVSSYVNTQNKEMPMYFMNQKGFTLLAMGYTGKEAMKFKEAYINEFERMEEELKKPRVLSEREQLVAAMKLSIESAEEIAVMKEEVVEVKTEMKEVRGLVENQITLDHGEQRRVQIGIASRIYELESDKELRSPLFAELYREIRNRFGVTSYKDIKRKDMMSALNYIEAWVPRRVS
jgi:Rha family phage regulatory protein